MIELSFKKLWIEKSDERRSLSELSSLYEPESEHIHGELLFKVNGVQLPYMGFFGEDDVCFNDWLYELICVSKLNNDEEYIFDEGEQGQPAYKFCRYHGTLYVSIIDSPLTGEPGDMEWQCKSLSFNEFTIKLQEMVNDFSKLLRENCPSICEEWLLNNLRT